MFSIASSLAFSYNKRFAYFRNIGGCCSSVCEHTSLHLHSRFLSGKRESREGTGTERVQKQIGAVGRGREGQEEPAAEPKHFAERP